MGASEPARGGHDQQKNENAMCDRQGKARDSMVLQLASWVILWDHLQDEDPRPAPLSQKSSISPLFG